MACGDAPLLCSSSCLWCCPKQEPSGSQPTRRGSQVERQQAGWVRQRTKSASSQQRANDAGATQHRRNMQSRKALRAGKERLLIRRLAGREFACDKPNRGGYDAECKQSLRIFSTSV